MAFFSSNRIYYRLLEGKGRTRCIAALFTHTVSGSRHDAWCPAVPWAFSPALCVLSVVTNLDGLLEQCCCRIWALSVIHPNPALLPPLPHLDEWLLVVAVAMPQPSLFVLCTANRKEAECR